jgi:hypothetical protein
MGPAPDVTFQDDLGLCGTNLDTQDEWCAKLNKKANRADSQLIWQLIAAILNGGETNENIDDVVAEATACYCNENCSRKQILSLARQLDEFNNSGGEFCGDGATTSITGTDSKSAGEGSFAAGGCSLIRTE